MNTSDTKYLRNRDCGLKAAEFERTHLQTPSTINLLVGQKECFKTNEKLSEYKDKQVFGK